MYDAKTWSHIFSLRKVSFQDLGEGNNQTSLHARELFSGRVHAVWKYGLLNFSTFVSAFVHIHLLAP